ncbi:SRPBCC domain-containing protein [Brachybacterium sp. YJGR34]|uniref:SRPBCC domain-containing protein n=1 Tax=Brachybacterium sp. YJGR34 TaxID=2059911 RepID=UPI000E0BA742|nr:SRPBCC domain-containing protein [Brachybacterium sp. YJGR34]
MHPAPEPHGAVVGSPRGRELQIERTVPADVDRVWAALTTSAGLEPWFGRLEGDPSTGRVAVLMTAEDDVATPQECTISTCTTPRLLSVELGAGEDAWRVRAELSAAEDGTNLLFTQVIGAGPVGSIGPGWEYYLERLSRSLAGGDAAEVAWEDYYPAMQEHYEALAR